MLTANKARFYTRHKLEWEAVIKENGDFPARLYDNVGLYKIYFTVDDLTLGYVGKAAGQAIAKRLNEHHADPWFKGLSIVADRMGIQAMIFNPALSPFIGRAEHYQIRLLKEDGRVFSLNGMPGRHSEEDIYRWLTKAERRLEETTKYLNDYNPYESIDEEDYD